MKNAKIGMLLVMAIAVSLAVFAGVDSAPGDDAREEPMMKFVPTSSNLVLSIDLAQMMALPITEEMMDMADEDDDMEFDKLLALLEKHNIDKKDALKRIVVFLDTDEEAMPGFITQTSIGEAALKEILQAEADELEIDLDTQRIGNRDVLLIKGKNEHMVPEGMEEFEMMTTTGLVYLDGEHVLISPMKMLEGMLEKIDAGDTLVGEPMERMAKVGRDSMIWAVYTGGFEFVPAEMRDGTPLANLAGLALSLGFIEQGQPDVRLKLDLEAVSEDTAQELFGGLVQMQMMIPMMLGEQYPQLANKITQSIAVEQPQPLEVLLTFTMDKDLQDMLKKMIDEMREQQQQQLQ